MTRESGNRGPGPYLKIQAAAFAAAVGVIALVAFAVDPWGIWHSVRIEGLNQLKFSAWRNQQLHKATLLACRRPDAVILGSSRALALSPAHPALRARAARPYNAALNAARILDLARYLELANAVGPPSDVVVALDFFMFGGKPQSQGQRDLDRLAWLSQSAGCVPDPGDWLPTLLSHDALTAVRRTLTRQRQIRRGSYTLPDGTWGARELLADFGRHGQRRYFRLTEAALMASVYQPMIDDPRLEEGFGTLRSMLMDARGRGVRVHVLISPFHARLGEVMHRMSLWDEFEDWKRRLVELSLETGDPPIWDFSGYNAVTTERVPAEGDGTARMRWYWDASHYSPETGDLVLDRILGYEDPSRPAPAGFGTRLDAASLEGHLRQIRADRARYLAAQGDDLADLAVVDLGGL